MVESNNQDIDKQESAAAASSSPADAQKTENSSDKPVATTAAEMLSNIASDKTKQAKLMNVIKALSAMKLCKEDSIPDAVLCRKVGASEDDEV